MYGHPRGVACLRMVSLTLARLLLVPGVLLAVEVGEPAPDFTLPSTLGELIRLSQFRGKQHVLLEFYVRDHGPTWMQNLSARQADYRTFQALGVQVLGIAAEHPFSQKPFADSLHLSYPLLSDSPALQVIQRYTGLQPHPSAPHRLAARRMLVLIDRQGIVRWQWQGETSDVVPSARIVQQVQEMTATP